MAGAYRLALSRATVEVTDPAGQLVATHTGVTATVRDGVARAKAGSVVVAEMAGAELLATSRKAYSVRGADGTTWSVTKPCGCSGG
jgi:hypothetical protein